MTRPVLLLLCTLAIAGIDTSAAKTDAFTISVGALRTQVVSDERVPENSRPGTVRNLDAWHDAFNVRRGQRLYLEPSARVRVW